MNNCTINSVHCTKFLGLIIDDKLTWSDHIREITKKVAKTVGIISRIRHFLPTNVLLTLYDSLILPHLNYGIILWGSSATSYLIRLVSLQKRCLRLITNSPYLSPPSPLFLRLKLLRLNDLFNYQIGIFLYNYTQNCLPEVFDSFFTENCNFHNYPTRTGNDLTQPYTRTMFAHSQIRSSGVLFWNSLSHHVKTSHTLNIFKRRLKSLLIATYD